jgi:DNA-binding response OmpR family regulator
MLTARADSVDRGRAMALGADAYISKPFAISEIMAAIGRLLKCDRFDPCAVAAE